MKNFIYLSIAGLIFASCSSGGDDPEPTPVNTAPSVPELVSPADNKLCLDNAVAFQWFGSTDEQKDQVSYEIQVAKDNTFSQIVSTIPRSSPSADILLEKNTAYYWRVKAIDIKNLASAYSATFKFYTSGEAVVNHLPFAPELVSPGMNTSLNATTATLVWNASDVDEADPLTYDVYFGTTNPPTEKISENKAPKRAEVTVEAGKQYFWKVVVKDNKGGETESQVWKFKTN